MTRPQANSRAAALLDIAQDRLRVIIKVIDELTALGADAELRVIALRLSEASFRAMSTGGK